MAWFLQSRYSADRSRAYRGTILNEADKWSRYRIIIEGTGAVSRYKLDRSKEFITGYKISGEYWFETGCRFQLDLSWEQGFAKTMTTVSAEASA